MIIGIGHDQIDGNRVKETLGRFGQRFLDRIFTPYEQARAAGKADPAPTYARRWAAKEAVAKALGTGIGEHAFMKEIGVENAANGQPRLVLTGRARETLNKLTPLSHIARLHLSLSDDWPFASAFVIIEAVPEHAPE